MPTTAPKRRRPRKLARPNGRAVKARGRDWENALVRWNHAMGFAGAGRNGAVHGSADRGDIGGVPWTTQAKNVTRVQMWEHLDQTLLQSQRAGTGDECFVAYKRPGYAAVGAGAGVVPMTFLERLLITYYGGNPS